MDLLQGAFFLALQEYHLENCIMMDIEKQFQEIKNRNARVEAEKAWEQSWTRRLLIAAGTYGCALLLFWSIHVQQPQIQGLIPSGAYLLSTFSLPSLKGWWLKRYRHTPSH